jgi:putative transposase
MAGTYTQLLFHVVFGTRGRRPWLRSEIRAELFALWAGMLLKDRCLLLEGDGVEDHVHLLLSLRARHSLASVVHRLKGRSARWINERFELPEPFRWQPGYSAFSVSASQVTRVRRYIQGQQDHHRSYSFDEEMDELLQRHGVSKQ